MSQEAPVTEKNNSPSNLLSRGTNAIVANIAKDNGQHFLDELAKAKEAGAESALSPNVARRVIKQLNAAVYGHVIAALRSLPGVEEKKSVVEKKKKKVKDLFRPFFRGNSAKSYGSVDLTALKLQPGQGYSVMERVNPETKAVEIVCVGGGMLKAKRQKVVALSATESAPAKADEQAA